MAKVEMKNVSHTTNESGNKSTLENSKFKRCPSKTSFNAGHSESIVRSRRRNDAKLDYYGRKLATASSDKTIRIFSVDNETGAYHKLAELTGYTGQVWQLSWSHPQFGSLLASASYDGRIIIWKEETDDSYLESKWAAIFDEQVHKSSVNSVSWAPLQLGATLAAGSSDGSISILTLCDQEIWTTARIMKAHELGCQSVSWRSSSGAQCLASSGNDCNIKLWGIDKAGEWVLQNTLWSHTDWVCGLEWSPVDDVLVSSGRDGKILVWTKVMGPEKPKWNHSSSFVNISMTHLDTEDEWTSRILHILGKGQIGYISWDPMGIMLCTAVDDKVLIWKKEPGGIWKLVHGVIDKEQ